MATEFKLPELGENIESADVIAVLVKAGDRLEKEQSVIEIETDKATIEVPSSVEGIITEVLVKEGDNIKVGKTIVKVDDSAEKIEPVTEKPITEEIASEEMDNYLAQIQIQIKCGNNGFSLKEISDILNGYGVTAHNISFDEPSLEDVFIEMTGSTISDKEGANGSQILV